MSKTAFPAKTLPTAEILNVMFHLAMVLTKRAMRKTIRVMRSIYEWLNAKHEFYGEDGDPIKCTGWQFVGYNIVAAVVAVLLCIRY